MITLSIVYLFYFMGYHAIAIIISDADIRGQLQHQ